MVIPLVIALGFTQLCILAAKGHIIKSHGKAGGGQAVVKDEVTFDAVHDCCQVNFPLSAC
jgi:hypothetical protein